MTRGRRARPPAERAGAGPSAELLTAAPARGGLYLRKTRMSWYRERRWCSSCSTCSDRAWPGHRLQVSRNQPSRMAAGPGAAGPSGPGSMAGGRAGGRRASWARDCRPRRAPAQREQLGPPPAPQPNPLRGGACRGGGTPVLQWRRGPARIFTLSSLAPGLRLAVIGWAVLSVSRSRVVRPAAGPRGAERPRRREGSGAGRAGAGFEGRGPSLDPRWV